MSSSAVRSRSVSTVLRRCAAGLVVGAVVVVAGYAGAGTAAAEGAGSLVVTRDGAVIEGREIAGYIHVRAHNVTIRDTVVRYGGSHAVRIFDGYTGTTIERSRINCTTARTNGVVFGGYVARQVDITGCRNGFMYSSALPATIASSTWNGAAVAVGTDPATDPVRDPATDPVTGPDGTLDAFPGPDSTGVPAGTTLRRSGSLTLDQDGQVITGLDIVGCVTVTARNVVLRASRITCPGRYSIRTIDAENLLVTDVEIDGTGRNSAAVCCTDYTLRRVNIHDVIDGPRLGDDTTVEDSWIHHLTRTSTSHNDTLQTTGAQNILVRNNRLEAYNPDTRDPFNACLMIGSTTAALVADLTFERNYCNGGNYSLGVRDDLNGERIVFRENTFGRDYRFGIIARPTQDGLSWDQASNVWLDSRLPVLR